MGSTPARIPPELIPEPFQAGELDALYDETERSRLHDRTPEAVPGLPVLRWEIDGPGTAEWAMRKLAVLTDHIAAVREQAAEWRDPIDRWEQAELKRAAHHQQFFQNHLERYALAQREAGAGATVALPSGKVATRASSPRLEVVDEQQVLDWADDLMADVATYDQLVASSVKLAGLQKLATIVEVPTGMNVVLACCGEVLRFTEGDAIREGFDGIAPPEVLSVWQEPCGACGQVDPGVAQVVVTDSRWEAQHAGAAIPGTRVIAPTTTAKATPR